MSKIIVCQNKMLRKIVGWVRHATNDWEIVMHNMKLRVSSAMDQWYVRLWDKRIQGARKTNFQRVANMNCQRWERLSMEWEPAKVLDDSQEYWAHRRAGRPFLRWTDKLANE